MSLSSVFTRRVRGFRLVELVSLVLLAVVVLGVYLAKTLATAERAQIARVEREIAQEKARVRLLHAEVAYLERPGRLSRLAQTYLGLAPVDAKREAVLDDLGVVATKPVVIKASAPAGVTP